MDHAKSALQSLKTSEEKYDVLYVNTPWSVMSTERLGNLPLNSICADNAALLVWTDSYTAPLTTQLMDKWGFKFHSVFQIMDIAQYPWMKKPSTDAAGPAAAPAAAPTDAPAAPASPDAPAAPAAPAAPEPKKKIVKKTRAPPVSPPSWWSPSPEGVVAPSRPTTEQLWLAVKGDPSAVFGNSTIAYNVVNLPELGKKSRSKKPSNEDSKWDQDRPVVFLETVLQHMNSGAKVLDLFSSTLHDKVDSWGPGLPGGYLKGFSKTNGIVAEINKVMRSMKKSQLQSLSQKIPKLLAATTEPDKTSILAELENAWTPILTALGTMSLPVSYNWKKDDGKTEDWAYTLVQILAQKNVADFSSIRKKRKKRQSSQKPGTRPRHGIACPSKVSKEMAEFLGMDPEEEIARTMVVKRINDYVKENSLKNAEKPIELLLDDRLQKLLNPPADFGTVTYFNLCKLVGAHFPKKTEEEKLADKKARDEAKKRKAEASKSEGQEKKKAKAG